MASILDTDITSTSELYSLPESFPDISNSRIILPDYDCMPTSPSIRTHSSTGNRFTNSFRLSRVHPLPPEIVESSRNGKECSQCCLRCLVVVTRLRWILVAIALLGAISVIVGIIFGVLNITLGSSFLTLSLTFIGLGVVLVLVVGVGWRCSPPGHEPCHAICHLDNHTSDDLVPLGESGRSRLHLHGRNQWFGGMLYPEFQYTAPPPSYNLSMQMSNNVDSNRVVNIDASSRYSGRQSSISNSLDNISLPRSPPPTYRSEIIQLRPMFGDNCSNISTNSRQLPPPYDDNHNRENSTSPPSSIISSNNITSFLSAGPTLNTEFEEDSIPVNQNPVQPIKYHVTVKHPDDLPDSAPSVRSMINRFEKFKFESSEGGATRRKGRYVKTGFQSKLSTTVSSYVCRAVIHEHDQDSNSDTVNSKGSDQSNSHILNDVDDVIIINNHVIQSDLSNTNSQLQQIKILEVANQQSRGTQTLSGNEAGFSDS